VSRGIWSRENKPRVAFDRPWKWLLLSGVVVQWIMYMFPAGGFAKVVSDTRVARSPLMTYFLSFAFYVAALFLLIALMSR
jgi:hypothetical protein